MDVNTIKDNNFKNLRRDGRNGRWLKSGFFKDSTSWLHRYVVENTNGKLEWLSHIKLRHFQTVVSLFLRECIDSEDLWTVSG